MNNFSVPPTVNDSSLVNPDSSAYLDSEVKNKVLELVSIKENVKRGDIVAALPRVEPHRITLILTKMVQNNEILRFGAKRGTFYRKVD